MTLTEALKKDKNGSYYEKWDVETGMWGVFGSESGFCYLTFSDKFEAYMYAKGMKRRTK
jgi:hypothetical protein